MMTSRTGDIRFSVVVASHGRPDWLRRCLLGLRQLDFAKFEIVLVADTESLATVDISGLRVVAFEQANLAEARNLGIAASGGDVCAFVDDDAVPEPLWLHHLARCFEETRADAVTGYVRGRNGISFQTRMTSVDAEAETHNEIYEDDTPHVPELPEGRALKLVGTNMAVRKGVFRELGGFDPLFRFFLEDADLSMRLVGAGCRLAVCPSAEVHHGFAPSVRRTKLRAPLDLFDIGRSTSVFLRKYSADKADEILVRLLRRERARLVEHMVKGTCEPGDVGKRMKILESGWIEGMQAKLQTPPRINSEQTFLRMEPIVSGHRTLSSKYLLKRRRTLNKAAKLVSEGERVSVFSFSLTPVRQHVVYTETGVWLQTGGLFGRSIRSGPRIKWCRFTKRVRQESRRIAKIRGISETA